jgi:chromate transporter
MVVAFVGFIGGWAKVVLGPDMLFVGAALAACVVTFFTFLPSFLFILVGGPLVEATHGKMKFTAPLTAITAAVVGVIANLAVFFAWHVWWPSANSGAPFSGTFEWISMLLTFSAALALMRFKINVIGVIAACGAAGMVKTWLIT